MTDSVQGWTPTPWFLVSAPEPTVQAIRRTRVVRRIAGAVRRHRVTCVTAPAGYGKTIAVSQWAARAGMPVAWLTLTRLDDDAARLFRGVVSALQEIADLTGDDQLRPLLAVKPSLSDLTTSYDALTTALQQIRLPVTLVIDDAHLGGAAMSDSVVAALAEHGVPELRIVLVGTGQPALPARLWLSESAARIGPDFLAFDVDEVAEAAAAIGQGLSTDDAAELHAATAGWPAAVRLTLLGQNTADDDHPARALAGEIPDLTDYIAGEVLGRLPDDLAEFVLATTTCARLNADLAAALSGREDSAALLAACASQGLFLDRFSDTGNEPVFRWHDLFAEQCREILHRRDPGAADHLNRIAARSLAEAYPLEAVAHAGRANDHELATSIIIRQWVRMVILSNTMGLEEVCARLPAPWNADPAILTVRACLMDIRGDRVGAAMLMQRASALPEPSDERAKAELALTRAVAALLLVDDHAELMDAVDELTMIVQTSAVVRQRSYGALQFLLGWAELRLRRDTARAAALLDSARRECAATGDHLIAHRATANLSWAYAFGGRFNAATALLGELTEKDMTHGIDPWQSYDGGIESMTAGLVALYRNDLLDAETHLQAVVDGGGGPASYAALARIYLTFIACDLRDPQRQLTAERSLRLVSDTTEHGMPWATYKLLAQCKLAEARGQVDEVLRLGEQLAGGAFLPVTTSMVAECLRRAGDLEQASKLLVAALAAPTGVGYIDACFLRTQALIEWTSGDTSAAHRLLEQSLDLATEESVAWPYSDSDPVLRELLVAHVAWGTHHEGFLAVRIAQTEATVSRKLVLGSPLSRREHEVLGFLRTSMTTADIAAALYVSINTVKTHQRAIYRKLGVTNRREAVKVTI